MTTQDTTYDDLEYLKHRTIHGAILTTSLAAGVLLYWNVMLYITASVIPYYSSIANVILLLTVFICWQIHKRANINLAAILLIGGVIVTIDISLLSPNALESFRPYLFLLVIALSSSLIDPGASFITAFLCSFSAIIVVGFGFGFETAYLKPLLAPGLLGFLIAFVTWGSANNLVTAFSWVLQSQQKTRKRRDELFESRQELQRAYKMLETANYRLEQAQQDLEQRAKELVELNAKLTVSEQELRKSNANKDKFFSIISHDLKNPFHAVLGFSEFLLLNIDDSSREDIVDIVETINLAARSTYKLLENLLEWSRMQLGRVKFHPQNTELSNLIGGNISLLSSSAMRKDVKLSSEFETDYLVFIDPNMINSVVQNLTTNALKFTPAGGEVKIMVQEGAKEGLVEVTVSDNGIGIKEEDIEKLFRIDAHHTTEGTNQEPGTGLGLILCKEMVEKNGGEIWIESTIGEGTQVKFTLPKAVDSG